MILRNVGRNSGTMLQGHVSVCVCLCVCVCVYIYIAKIGNGKFGRIVN